jgi:hypothetical protein
LMGTMMEFPANSSGANSCFCFTFCPDFGDTLAGNIYKGVTVTF